MVTKYSLFLCLFALRGLILSSCDHVINAHDECPFEPCVDSNLKPKLRPDEPLVISIYWDQIPYGSKEVRDIFKFVCQITTKFGGSVSMDSKPGALVAVNENEKMLCGDFCYGDRQQVCYDIADPASKNSCSTAPVPKRPYDRCMNEGQADGILVDNGQKRQKLLIPECRLPAVAFNGVYDLCGDFNTYEKLEAYVCEIYDYAFDGCDNYR